MDPPSRHAVSVLQITWYTCSSRHVQTNYFLQLELFYAPRTVHHIDGRKGSKLGKFSLVGWLVEMKETFGFVVYFVTLVIEIV